MFTARYALSPYIKQLRFVLTGLIHIEIAQSAAIEQAVDGNSATATGECRVGRPQHGTRRWQAQPPGDMLGRNVKGRKEE